jgi:DNA-binding response OmpR family regulator
MTATKYNPRVLVIEDEADLREALVSYLHLEGFSVHGAASLAATQTAMAAHDYDVLLLDLGLPDGDGLGWLQTRQDLRDKGVIIATARGDDVSRISGLRAGADAYLVKPALPEEIALLIRNLMRRLRGDAPQTWWLDKIRWQLTAPGGQPIKLTHSEHLILLRLAERCGEAISRQDLAICLGHNPEHYDYRRMEVMVRRLRNKVKQELDVSLPLDTAHRQGYAFTASMELM